MKKLILLLIIIPQIVSGQVVKRPDIETSALKLSSGKQYVYKVNLYKISSTSYPGAKVQLKMMQNAAILDGNAMLYPEIRADHGPMFKVCPIILFGYKKNSFSTEGKCSVTEQGSLSFTNDIVLGKRFSMPIPADRLTAETKLVVGIYGAEITLPNGTSKVLKKANLRSFRLIDMDFSVRNYIKYEVNIDGATITLEYIIERSAI
ncbi:hypothetical protein [Gynurincola endophyticus]|uniref:hypothetical protein n=1 Tax=Gynurincola endophyticus TaxID=2479004 RepID=UPI000F8F1E2F|nr:hypothetical protein [Gynurincola endophyticus]